MNIIIDQNLREYRENRGNTQEELAEYLAISSQAVSKWERGESMPDIALLPRIAAYYDVTVDDLLGVGELRKQEKIAAYIEKSDVLFANDRYDEAVAILREIQRDFPNDTHVMHLLAIALYSAYSEEASDTYYGKEEVAREIISVCERILRESTNQHDRSTAIGILCPIYANLGDRNRAMKYAKMSCNLWDSVEMLLQDVLEGEELKEHSKVVLYGFLIMIGKVLMDMCQNENHPRQEKLHQFYLDLLNLCFDDERYGSFAYTALRRHLWLAHMAADSKNEEKGHLHLEEMEKFVEQFDSLFYGIFTYSSTLFNGITEDLTKVNRSNDETQAHFMLESLSDSIFNIWRNKDWFKNLEDRLHSKLSK